MHASNPFSTPQSDVEVARPEVVDETVLAERSTRLGASIVDGLLAMAALIPAMVAGFDRMTSGSPFWFIGSDISSIAATALWVGLMVLQAYFVSVSGQSIGKKLFSIKIVKLDGQLPGFVHGVLIRMWALAAIGYIPVIGAPISGFVGLVDALMIFGEDRRCLHDRLAGTKVIIVPRA